MLLWISHLPVGPHLHRQGAGDRSVLSHSAFVSTCCRALRAASPAFSRNRAGPREFFANRLAFLIRRDDGPPGSTIEGRQVLMRAVKKTASQANSLGSRTFDQNPGRIQN